MTFTYQDTLSFSLSCSSQRRCRHCYCRRLLHYAVIRRRYCHYIIRRDMRRYVVAVVYTRIISVVSPYCHAVTLHWERYVNLRFTLDYGAIIIVCHYHIWLFFRPPSYICWFNAAMPVCYRRRWFIGVATARLSRRRRYRHLRRRLLAGRLPVIVSHQAHNGSLPPG